MIRLLASIIADLICRLCGRDPKKPLLIVPILLVACGGQIGGFDPQPEETQEDPDCAVLDAYWQALADGGCVVQGPGSADLETSKEGHTCQDSVAALDACYADASCRGPHSLSLLATCTGLAPWWPRFRGSK